VLVKLNPCRIEVMRKLHRFLWTESGQRCEHRREVAEALRRWDGRKLCDRAVATQQNEALASIGDPVDVVSEMACRLGDRYDRSHFALQQ
jgi:hypothetical protein